MRKMFLLAKTLLKSGGGLVTNKRGRSKWVLPAVLVFAFASFGSSMFFIASKMYEGLASAGAQDIILPLIMGATSLVVFLFGIFYVISVMYHADDVEKLMYLPLKPAHILGAKFITLVIYEYIFEAFILLPVLAAYIVGSGAGVLFIIYTLLLFILLPVIALSMAAVLVMIVMRFTSFGKNKQAFRFVGGIIAIALAIGFNLFIQTSVNRMMTDMQFAAALQNSDLVSVFSNMFPGIIFASNTLIHSASIEGLGNFALFVICSCGAFAVFLGLGQLVYIKGVSGITESSAKRKGVRDLTKETRSTSGIRAYLKKEIRMLMRSPIAFLNCVLVTFIWPVLIVIIFFSGAAKLAMLTALVLQADDATIIAILTGFCAFVACANAITSTAISREGKSLYIAKYIPLDMRSQLFAKILTGMIFSGISVVFTMVIAVFIGIDLILALVSLVLGIVVLAACSYVGIIIDAANPKLEWVNEQQAIKQNLNVILHMLAGVLLGAVAIVPVVMLPMSAVVAVVYIAAVFGILLAVLVSRVNNFAAAKIESMDV